MYFQILGDQQRFKMPAEEGTEDVLDGEEYPDGKIELFSLFESHMKNFYHFFALTFYFYPSFPP